MGRRKRLFAIPLGLLAILLVFIINGAFFTYPQEVTPNNNQEPNNAPDNFFHIPEIPSTLIPLVLGLVALLIIYWKK